PNHEVELLAGNGTAQSWQSLRRTSRNSQTTRPRPDQKILPSIKIMPQQSYSGARFLADSPVILVPVGRCEKAASPRARALVKNQADAHEKRRRSAFFCYCILSREGR